MESDTVEWHVAVIFCQLAHGVMQFTSTRRIEALTVVRSRAGYCGFVPAAADIWQGQQQPGQRATTEADMLLLTLDQYSRGCQPFSTRNTLVPTDLQIFSSLPGCLRSTKQPANYLYEGVMQYLTCSSHMLCRRVPHYTGHRSQAARNIRLVGRRQGLGLQGHRAFH